jgi:hypothetical protein
MRKTILAAMLAAFAFSTIAPAIFADKAFAQDGEKKEKKKKEEKKE